ncbi:hypothetical protein L0F63_001897, partial [Massospora cicadina]
LVHPKGKLAHKQDIAKGQLATHLAKGIKAILLGRADAKGVQISVIALQDSGTWAKVFERLLEMSSSGTEVKGARAHAQHRTGVRVRKRKPKRQLVRRTARKAPAKPKPTLQPEPSTTLTITRSLPSTSIADGPALGSNKESPNATLVESSDDAWSGGGYRLTPKGANRLCRRQALLRRKAPDPKPFKLKADLEQVLPLDRPHQNGFKRCLRGLFHRRRGGRPNLGFGRRHHLQRAHLPVDLGSHVPAHEQVRSYINPKEIEAYRRSGMTLLNLDTLDPSPDVETPRHNSKPINPSLIETLHDIWYEDLSPPTDAVSVFVYWWGYEVYLPKAILDRLQKRGSTTNAALALLAVLTSAIPFIQPYIKVLSAFITLEASASELFHTPGGTVLTATWILPFLIIPRPIKILSAFTLEASASELFHTPVGRC